MKPVFPAIWLSMRGVWVLLALALCLAIASVVPVLLVAVGALFFAFVVLLVVDAALGPSWHVLHITRRPVPPLSLGRAVQLTYDIQNRAALAVRLGLVEAPSALLASLQSPCVNVAARSRATTSLDVTPRERGRAVLGTFYVWTENRIGMLRRRFAIEAREEVHVFPDLGRIESAGVLARRKTLLEAGLRRMRRSGAGSEFESLREYGPGDAFGAIEWKATARRGRVMVVQHQPERSQNVIVLLDCGRLMLPRVGSQRKFDYALTAALSVARVAQAADDNVGLYAFAARPLLEIAPRRGAAHYRRLAQAAYDLQPRFEEPDYETTFAQLRRRYAKRSLMIAFTDLFDPVASTAVLSGLATLVPRHLVVCVLMNDAAVAAALDAPPTTVGSAFRTAVAMRLDDERAKAVAVLRGRGIIVLDVPAPRLTVALIDAYVDVKQRGRL